MIGLEVENDWFVVYGLTNKRREIILAWVMMDVIHHIMVDGWELFDEIMKFSWSSSSQRQRKPQLTFRVADYFISFVYDLSIYLIVQHDKLPLLADCPASKADLTSLGIRTPFRIICPSNWNSLSSRLPWSIRCQVTVPSWHCPSWNSTSPFQDMIFGILFQLDPRIALI